MRYEDLPEDQRLIAGGEDVRDTRRERHHDNDSPVETAARKYLKSRGRRMDIEFEARSRIDAFPYRLVEIFRARRFARIAGVELNEKSHIDDLLPSLARITIDELNSGKTH